MFLRTTRNNQGKTYLQIVRSYRDNGRSRHEILFTLGRLDILQATGELDGLINAMSRFAAKQNLIDLAKDISIDQVYHLGAAHVVSRMLDRLGLKRVLESIARQHPKLKFMWDRLIEGMIMGRFVEPCSKKRLHDHWWNRIYPDLLSLKNPPLQWFYRALDILYDHKEDIERALFDRNGERDLFNQTLDVVFYDTTTLRFESTVTEENALRQFGYSKERRSDCTQVVLGLLIDADGIPVGYHLFPGNTYDGQSLHGIISKLKNKYSIGRVILVADRGMLSNDNMASLRSANMEFIIGMRLWSVAQKRQEEFYDLKRYRPLKKGLKIRELPWKGDRLILTWSQDRAQRDAKAREDLLEKIRQKLGVRPDAKRFVHSAYRQYLEGLDEGKPRLNQKAIAHAQKRDGFFGVLTNIAGSQLGSSEVVSNYKELWKIEDAFGEIKGPLETRPIFHWTDKRIEAHILVCLLAYYIEAVVTKELRSEDSALTTGEFLRSLNEVFAIPVKVRSAVAWVRNELPVPVAKGYQALRLKPPDRVLKIEGKAPA